MTPINIIFDSSMLLMGYILSGSIVALRNPVGFGSIFFLASFSDFLIAKNIIGDIQNSKKKIKIKEECVGEVCNIPVLTTAS